jgi:hypothetical protein
MSACGVDALRAGRIEPVVAVAGARLGVLRRIGAGLRVRQSALSSREEGDCATPDGQCSYAGKIHAVRGPAMGQRAGVIAV